MDVKGFLQKKFAGIPVLYLLGVAVGIFAFVAWKLKPADTSSDSLGAPGTGDAGADVTGVTTGDLAGSVYDGLKTAGTVVVAPSSDTIGDTTPTIKTNATWLNDGVQWLVAQDKATGSVANAALSKYLQGQDRSYNEQELVDLWYKQGGPPPDGVEPAGTIGSKPAQKQFEQPPGVHTVKGTNDNDYTDMLNLYYGGRKDQESYDLLQAANEKLGLSGPWGVGTKINIPVWHPPKYYVTPSDMTTAQVASKNGITAYQINALNNTSKNTWPKGSKVRVA